MSRPDAPAKQNPASAGPRAGRFVAFRPSAGACRRLISDASRVMPDDPTGSLCDVGDTPVWLAPLAGAGARSALARLRLQRRSQVVLSGGVIASLHLFRPCRSKDFHAASGVSQAASSGTRVALFKPSIRSTRRACALSSPASSAEAALSSNVIVGLVHQAMFRNCSFRLRPLGKSGRKVAALPLDRRVRTPT